MGCGNMALMACPECNKKVSDKAETCPNCGFPISRKRISDKFEKQEELVQPKLPNDFIYW